MFGNNDYSYRTSWVSMPPSLSTPSTCFTSRYFTLPTATYRTPFSRYDRSNSTPLRYNESVGHFYNRCISEYSPRLNIEANARLNDNKTISSRSCSTFNHDNLTERETLYRTSEPTKTFKKDKGSDYDLNRKKDFNFDSNKTYLQSPKKTTNNIYSSHIARYYQRINDIFEKQEEVEEDVAKSYVTSKGFTSTEHKPRATFKSVLEDVKDLEKKYRKMNFDTESRRPKTELDHYRPDNVINNSTSFSHPRQYQKSSYLDKGDRNPSDIQQKSELSIVRDSNYDKLYQRTLQLYRDAATPPSRDMPSDVSTYNNSYYNSSRYLADKPRIDYRSFGAKSCVSGSLNNKLEQRSQDLQTFSKTHPRRELEAPSLVPDKSQDIPEPTEYSKGLYCGLKRRYTNRESKLAKQLLEHIKTEKKWTNSVDKPFVLGI